MTTLNCEHIENLINIINDKHSGSRGNYYDDKSGQVLIAIPAVTSAILKSARKGNEV